MRFSSRTRLSEALRSLILSPLFIDLCQAFKQYLFYIARSPVLAQLCLTRPPIPNLIHQVSTMRSTLLVKEPQPTTSHPYQHTGIGGAGNVRRIQPPTSLSNSSPYVLQPSSPSPSRFSTGRGGAGNIPRAGDYRPMFSLDEEVDRRDKPAPVTYHTGRGGEGNLVHMERRDSTSSDGSRRSSSTYRSLDIAREWLKKW